MEKLKNTYFPALTGVRIIAAYMVYLHHFNPFTIEGFGSQVHYFFDSLHVGVTLFFVLSGFLIAHRYYDLGDFDFKLYLKKRFARIYPMYFILTSLTFLFGLFITKSYGGLANYTVNITFLKGFFDDLKFSGIPQSWTLTVEEMFYFLAPLFFILIKRRKWLLFLLPFIFVLIGFGLVQIFKDFDWYGLMGNLNFMLGYTFFGRIFEFFVGIALALFLRNENRFSFKYFTILGVTGTVLSVFILSLLEQQANNESLYLQKNVVNNLILPVFGIAPLFYGLIHEKTIIFRTLSSQLFILLGKSSYVFYLIHIGFFRTFLEYISLNELFIFISLNLIAIALYFVIEKPLQHYFTKR